MSGSNFKTVKLVFRIGRQPVIRISSILLAISLLSLSFASLYEVLLVIQFVIGFSFVIIFYTGYILGKLGLVCYSSFVIQLSNWVIYCGVY